MDNEGYPENKELKLIKEWDYKDVFNLMNYVEDCWWTSSWGYKKYWKIDYIGKRNVLHIELHTGGWSGNESIINSLLENNFVNILWYAEWKRGGHYKFIINPFNIGYQLVSEYCKSEKVSRQYVHKIKDRFDWVIISEHKRLLRKKV